MVFEAGLAEDFVDSLVAVGPRDFVERGEEVEILSRGKPWEERTFGSNGDANLATDFAGIALRVASVDADGTGIRKQHSRDDLERGRLATAIGTEKRDDFGIRDGERELFQSNGFACALAPKPVEQRGAVAKNLADGFEDDLIHENACRSMRDDGGWSLCIIERSWKDSRPIAESEGALETAGKVPALRGTRALRAMLFAHARPLVTVHMSETLVSPKNFGASVVRGDQFRLLCACASVHPSAEQASRIAEWNWAGFEWEGFFALADQHGVMALVAHNLTRHGTAIPGKIAQALASTYDENLKRSLWFAAELARIVGHFESRQVRVVPYKGPLLAQTAYGDVGLRSSSDLDLLLSPADFERGKQVLAEIGYRPSEELAPAVERFYLRTGYERSFDGPAGKYLVELQWALLPHFYAVDSEAGSFRVNDLLARTGRVDLCGAQLPCLAAEDSLLALCLHAAKHLWTRLMWVVDIAESVRMPGVDFDLVAKRARALGIERIVGVSFRLAERLLGAVVPEGARALIADDPEEMSLAEEFAARLERAANYDLDSSAYFRKILRLRERADDRRRYLWRLFWTPGPGELAAVTLPEALFPLYRLVRMGRLLRKVV